jgi:hypothetical protein
LKESVTAHPSRVPAPQIIGAKYIAESENSAPRLLFLKLFEIKIFGAEW